MTAVIDPARWLVVVNPASGAGRARRYAPRLAAALERAGIRHDIVASGSPGACAKLTADAVAAGARRLLAVGGDGTLHELIAGLLASGVAAGECLVGAAAGGTGNDWARTLAMPDDPERLAACMARGRARTVDLGRASAGGRRSAFHTVAGAGLDAEVIRCAARRGPPALAYLAGLARTLARYRAPQFRVQADGVALAGRYLLVLAAIGPRCGGGMRLAPGAVPDDGWLDVVMVDPMPLAAALARLPRLFDGRLAGDPAFRVLRCRQALIEADPACASQLDGELFGPTPLGLEVAAGALRALDCRDSP